MEIARNAIHKECDLIESSTIDFDWGTIFFYNTREYIQTKKNPLVGNSPFFIDKFDGSVNRLCSSTIMDKQLEKYREKKGYKHVIKFKIKEDLETMSDIEKVFALMKTTEIIQIEKAIEIVKSKNLFDLKGLG